MSQFWPSCTQSLTKWHCSNYTSAEFAAVLGGLGIRQSVGRTGICYDNALAESFNGMLKVERVYRTVYPTREMARKDIARYIEIRYNPARTFEPGCRLQPSASAQLPTRTGGDHDPLNPIPIEPSPPDP